MKARVGPLALIGGDEFHPGNEPQDRVLVQAAGEGPAFVLATAAAGQRPGLAVHHAKQWFATLGLDVEELPATSRAMVEDPDVAARAREGKLFYLVGGDPRRVPSLLGGSRVWQAVVEAWRGGAALGGSSAGAMALARWALLPGNGHREFSPGLGLVEDLAVVPHFNTFGATWPDDAMRFLPSPTVRLMGIDERSAAVWLDGSWVAMGTGGVTVIDEAKRLRFEPGAVIEGIPQPRSGA